MIICRKNIFTCVWTNMALKMFNKRLLRNLFLNRFFSGDHKINTVGIIVIGDEILKGDVADTNSAFLASELHSMGLSLKKISVIGDNIGEVSSEVRSFSNSYDYVITTGGIGPTHDDITYEAAAAAFDVPLELNSELKEICIKFFKTTNIDNPGFKLARVPKTAKLNYNTSPDKKMKYPTVSINNVYMFPGIPEFLKKSFINLKDILFTSNKRFYTKNVYMNVSEVTVAGILDLLVAEYPDVQFGSYPKVSDSNYQLKITIESISEESTNQAYKKLLRLVPQEYISKFNNKDKEK